jgi:hypothetical protein
LCQLTIYGSDILSTWIRFLANPQIVDFAPLQLTIYGSDILSDPQIVDFAPLQLTIYGFAF